MNKNSVREKFFTYMLHSYIVYLHLDQTLFMNFSSGKELGELEFKIMYDINEILWKKHKFSCDLLLLVFFGRTKKRSIFKKQLRLLKLIKSFF